MSQSTASDRLRIDKWLRQHLHQGDLHGLEWLGKPEDGIFCINWSHKSANSWNMASKENNVFLAYFRARCGRRPTSKDYKQLKQNLRCALRGSRHLQFDRELSLSRGSDARRAYRFLAEPRVPSLDSSDLSGHSGSPQSSPIAISPEELLCLNVDSNLLVYFLETTAPPVSVSVLDEGVPSSPDSPHLADRSDSPMSSPIATSPEELPCLNVDSDLLVYFMDTTAPAVSVSVREEGVPISPESPHLPDCSDSPMPSPIVSLLANCPNMDVDLDFDFFDSVVPVTQHSQDGQGQDEDAFFFSEDREILKELLDTDLYSL